MDAPPVSGHGPLKQLQASYREDSGPARLRGLVCLFVFFVFV